MAAPASTLAHSTPRARTAALSKPGTLYHEPTPRWHRAWVADHVDVKKQGAVLDSKRASLVWEDASMIPYLAFQLQDVPFQQCGSDAEKLTETRNEAKGGHLFRPSTSLRPPTKFPKWGNLASQFYDLYTHDGTLVREHAGWTWSADVQDISQPGVYPSGSALSSSSSSAPSPAPASHLFGVDPSAFETWYEEAEPMLRGSHAKDPYHRVDAVKSSRHVQVYVLPPNSSSSDNHTPSHGQGILLADTRHPTMVFETGMPTRYYLHPSAILTPPSSDASDQPLSPEFTALRTVCPYKGVARYHNVVLPGDVEIENLVWTYPDPYPECQDIEGLLCFYAPGPHCRLVVDGEEVKA